MPPIQSIKKLEGWSPSFSDVRDYFENKMDPNTMDLDDQDVYSEIYGKGRWAGIFQCIAEGSMVDTPSGPRPIEQLCSGDWITSICPDGSMLDDIVQDVDVHDGRECVELKFDDGSTLIVTDDHWVMTAERGWQQVCDIDPDEEIIMGPTA